MGDADDSYDFSEVPKFVAKWREGYELVMGNRLRGVIKPGAMPLAPPIHRDSHDVGNFEYVFSRRNR